jgi:D-alanyl-D-alanine carboxypeptidase/D-alanyl-D-alanine-endopeptidase (penicillin-binding protein 4)
MMIRRPSRRHSLARSPLLRLLLAALVVFLATATAAAYLATPSAAQISSKVDTILRARSIDATATGIRIWDIDAARDVHSRNPDLLLTPASNMKLVTGAAALLNWGADHRLFTELHIADVPVVDGVLYGDLYLRGLGDPSLSTRSYQRDTLHFETSAMEAFVRSVRASGIAQVRGRVVADETWFDRRRVVALWRPSVLHACAPLSALTGNGAMREGKAAEGPATHAAELLTKKLRGAGIKITGRPATGQVPAGARLLQQQRSAPMRVLIKRMNKESDNHFAEIMLKGLGKDFNAQGTTEAGAMLSEAVLATMDVPANTYVVQDGSGLSYGNRLTANTLVRLLVIMRQRPDYKVFHDSLPIAGRDGSLRDRMRDSAAAGNARAKTGSLAVASSLSGYVTSANGHLVAFSMMMAGDPVDWRRSQRAQDEIVEMLAEATLPGERQIRVSPILRQHVASSAKCVHTVGGALQPCVEP